MANFVLPDGRRLHYRDEGRGSTAVLLHGFPLHSAMWEPQVATLAGRYRLVLPDLAGFGASDPPADPWAQTIDDYADDVIALVEHLSVAPVPLVGLSMGGYVALALWRRRPEALSSLVLADTRPGADTPANRQQRSEQQEWLTGGGDTPALVDRLAPNLVGAGSSRRSETLARVRALAQDNPPEGWIGALQAMKQRPDVTAELARIGVPTLVLVGDQDAITPPDVATAMHAAIPGAQLTVVPDAGHLSNVENPEAFTEALEHFLAT